GRWHDDRPRSGARSGGRDRWTSGRSHRRPRSRRWWRRPCCGLFALYGICGEQVAACLFSFAVRRCPCGCVFANALNGGFVGGLGGLVAAVGRRGVATTAHGGTGSGAGRTLTARTARTTTLFALGARRAVQRRRIVAAQGVALVDPHLHADDAVGRLGFGEAVVDVGTQGVQRHTAFAVPLGTGDFDAVQTARGHDLDALGAQAHGVLHRAFHGAAEHDALFELLADR